MKLILEYAEWLKTLSEKGDPSSLEIDWGGKLSGKMIEPFSTGPQKIIGIGAKTKDKNRTSWVLQLGSAALRGTAWAKYTPPTPGKSEPRTVIPSIDFTGTDFPYPDNIITPNWSISPSAKAKFDDMINDLVKYFKDSEKMAMANFKSIAIEGAADIANATNTIPAGYDKLDHNYDGKAPNNEFLAKNRALKMQEEIVKALTGKVSDAALTFIKSKMTTSSKTGLPRGQRYVKIAIDSNPYEMTTPGGAVAGKLGEEPTSGSTDKAYVVFADQILKAMFPKISSAKIETVNFRPGKDGQSDFKAVKLDALNAWSKQVFGSELASTEEIKDCQTTVTPLEDGFAIDFKLDKMFIPPHQYNNNTKNRVIVSEATTKELKNRFYIETPNYAVGWMSGLPFGLCYQSAGDFVILKSPNVSLNPYS